MTDVRCAVSIVCTAITIILSTKMDELTGNELVLCSTNRMSKYCMSVVLIIVAASSPDIKAEAIKRTNCYMHIYIFTFI